MKDQSPVQLRPYQLDAVARLDQHVAAAVRRVLLVAPTGSGKTTIAAHIIVQGFRAGQRTLFVAHRRELIGQAYARLVQMGVPEREVGVIMSSDPRRKPGAHVQVASIDTLRNRAKPLADVVFVDEAHRATAPSYQRLQEHYTNAVHLGLTATPYRADGRGLGDAYDEIVVVATPAELIAQGYLVEPRVFTVPQSKLPDLSGVRTQRGDFDQKQLAESVDTSALVGNMVAHWHEHASELRTVAFAVSVAHSKHIVDQFRRVGVRAEHLDGKTPKPERDAILARLDSFETQLVSNCGVLCEGWDQPSVKCAILARPTQSTGLYLQQAGRILRPWGDVQAIILDHAGCARMHGLPQMTRSFSLDTTKKRGRKSASAPAARVCQRCFAVVDPASPVCPSCGALLPKPRRPVPAEVNGELVEVVQTDFAVGGTERQREVWNEICRTAIEKGYKPGWVFFRFRDRFGVKPPAGFKLPTKSNTLDVNVRDTLRRAARTGAETPWDLF